MLRYFRKFRRKTRLRVKYVCIDMYRPYVELIKTVFPNAKIIYDSFHIVNLISRALTKTRINSMKKFPINSMEYERLKRYWKLIQKDSSDLDCIEYKYFPHFKTWKSSRDVVEQSIEADEVLKYNYRVYQVLLSDIKNRDSNMLRNHLESFKSSPYINTYMYIALNTLVKDFEYVSNGCIEGINNYIKTLKRVAFSYKSFYHFKNRILISQKMIFPKKKDQATKSTLVA
ncbi:MAG: transposase [Andreesenia angusta]|nr:transposase [Andreesenia angusta]